MATSSTVPTVVQGGRHHGMPFAPTNGVAAKQRVETEIAELRSRERRAHGRMLDEMESGFRQIERRRKMKWNIA